MTAFRSTRTALLLGGLLAVAACRDALVPTAPERTSLAAGGTAATPGSRIIVVFDRAVPDPPGLARELAARYGGTVDYEPNPEGGALFRVRLPLEREEAKRLGA